MIFACKDILNAIACILQGVLRPDTDLRMLLLRLRQNPPADRAGQDVQRPVALLEAVLVDQKVHHAVPQQLLVPGGLVVDDHAGPLLQPQVGEGVPQAAGGGLKSGRPFSSSPEKSLFRHLY